MIALAVAVVVAAAWWRRGAEPTMPALAGWGIVAHPLPAAAALVVVSARRRWTRAVGVTRRERAADGDVVLLADLMALGLTAGKTVRGALETSIPHLEPDLAAAVGTLVEEMNRVGASPALAAAGGRLTPLARVVASAVASGAPVAGAVAAHADHLRHLRHTEEVTAARRLPVRLLLPLALLILPGFVVLAVGPAVIQALARLGPIP